MATHYEIASEFFQQACQQRRHQRDLSKPVLSLANRKRLARQGLYLAAPVVREAIAAERVVGVDETTWNARLAMRGLFVER